jgi:exonuclease-1
MLLLTCILSGCDYLDSIKGIGFKKAHKLVYECGNDFKEIVKKIRREGKHVIPPCYESEFEKALLTFKFQRVYCPK